MKHVLDLFAGAGGFSLGFQLAGFKIVGAVEKDKWASESFQVNHPKASVISEDIEGVSSRALRTAFSPEEPDVIIGGPPCQGFSICMSNGRDPKDPRNSLFTEFVRVVDVFRPQLAIMENVPHLLKAKTTARESVIAIITRRLESLGYCVYYKVLEATDFGVPQIRKRLFIVASKSPLSMPFPDPTHIVRDPQTAKHMELFSTLSTTPTLWDAIGDLPQIGAGEGSEVQSYTSPPQHEFQCKLRKGATALFNHKAMRHTPRMIARFEAMTYGVSVNELPVHLRPRRRNSSEVATFAYDQNNRRMRPDQPCHTIPASFYANFVHPYLHRNFTAREGARIQSFPDWYRFMGKPTVVSKKLLRREGREAEAHLCQYEQIGNAVPPLLAKALAEHLKRQLTTQRATHARSRQ